MISRHPIFPRKQIEIVGLRAFRAPFRDRLFFFGQQFELQRGDDRIRDLILDGKDVGEVAVESFGPDMASGGAVNELSVDSYPVADFADAALEDMGNTQLPRDIADIHRSALKGEGRVPRDHLQCRNLRQVGRDVLADAVTEIFLLGISAHVLERQHAD